MIDKVIRQTYVLQILKKLYYKIAEERSEYKYPNIQIP